MTDIYLPGIPDVFRIIPRKPEYAIAKTGQVLNLRTNKLMTPKDDSRTIIDREETPGRLHEVDVLIKEVFGDGG